MPVAILVGSAILPLCTGNGLVLPVAGEGPIPDVMRIPASEQTAANEAVAGYLFAYRYTSSRRAGGSG